MTAEALALIAQELDRADTPCVTASFQAECVVLVHMLRQYQPRHPGAVSRHGASLRRDLPLSRSDRRAVGSQPGHAAGGRARSRPLAREHAGLLRPAQGRSALRGAEELRHLVHWSPPRSVAIARRAAGDRAVQLSATPRRCARSARSPGGRRRMSGATRKTTTSRGCRFTTTATRASAASRAPRCHWIGQRAIGTMGRPEARMRNPHPGQELARDRPSASDPRPVTSPTLTSVQDQSPDNHVPRIRRAALPAGFFPGSAQDNLAIRPHDHPARGPPQEGRVDERRNHVMARRIVHAPESRGLGGGQSKTRHFDEFTADALDEGVVLHGVLFVSPAGVPGGRTPAVVESKRYATRHREYEAAIWAVYREKARTLAQAPVGGGQTTSTRTLSIRPVPTLL